MVKFIIEVEEEFTYCRECPFCEPNAIDYNCGFRNKLQEYINCSDYDLRTLKITKQDETTSDNNS